MPRKKEKAQKKKILTATERRIHGRGGVSANSRSPAFIAVSGRGDSGSLRRSSYPVQDVFWKIFYQDPVECSFNSGVCGYTLTWRPVIVVLRDLYGGDGVSEAVAFAIGSMSVWCWMAVNTGLFSVNLADMLEFLLLMSGTVL